MKKICLGGTVLIALLALAFLAYGIHLNRASNSHIAAALADRAVTVSGARAAWRDIFPSIHFDYVMARAVRQSDVIAMLDGMVAELAVAAGDRVTAGQPLGRVINHDLPLTLVRADLDISQGEAAVVLARNKLDRYNRLSSGNAISVYERELAGFEVATAQASFDNAKVVRQQLRQQEDFETLRAPMDGVVAMVYQRVGNFVSEGQPVLLIIDMSRLYFTALVEDEKIRNLEPVAAARQIIVAPARAGGKAFDFSAPAGSAASAPLPLRVTEITPRLTEKAPLRRIRCEIDNRRGLMEPGMNAAVSVRGAAPVRALAIPRAALWPAVSADAEPGVDIKPAVYIKDEAGRLVRRQIETGVYDDNFVAVQSGLREGDVVITSRLENPDALAAGVKLRVQEAPE